jgi:hypothetical protein
VTARSFPYFFRVKITIFSLSPHSALLPTHPTPLLCTPPSLHHPQASFEPAHYKEYVWKFTMLTTAKMRQKSQGTWR